MFFDEHPFLLNNVNSIQRNVHSNTRMCRPNVECFSTGKFFPQTSKAPKKVFFLFIYSGFFSVGLGAIDYVIRRPLICIHMNLTRYLGTQI